jgi:hypothetical protein
MGGDGTVSTEQISVSLSRDQALVLYEWLARTNAADRPAAFEDQAEQRALWDLAAALESMLVEPLRADYWELVNAARSRLRDGGI